LNEGAVMTFNLPDDVKNGSKKVTKSLLFRGAKRTKFLVKYKPLPTLFK